MNTFNSNAQRDYHSFLPNRHVQPMAAFSRDMLNHKYYRHAEGGNREIMHKMVLEEKKKVSGASDWLVLVLILGFFASHVLPLSWNWM